MTNTFSWNSSGIKSKQDFDRLIKLVKIHKDHFVALHESFITDSKLEQYRKWIGFKYAMANRNGKILFFLKYCWSVWWYPIPTKTSL